MPHRAPMTVPTIASAVVGTSILPANVAAFQFCRVFWEGRYSNAEYVGRTGRKAFCLLLAAELALQLRKASINSLTVQVASLLGLILLRDKPGGEEDDSRRDIDAVV